MAQMTKKTNPVMFEDVRILFRNFSGEEGRYNAKGNRNFVLPLEQDVAESMKRDGWNIKYLKPRDEHDDPTPYVEVTVKFDGARPPRVVMITSRGRNELDEGTVSVLDWADIKQVDLILNPYHWDVNGKTGIKAYLKSLFVTIEEDALELKYADVPDSAQNIIGAGQERLQIESGRETVELGEIVAEVSPPWDE